MANSKKESWFFDADHYLEKAYDRILKKSI
jgi:hypothetical protein